MRAAAHAPPLSVPSTESSDDESYSSFVSTDDDEELTKIFDPDELEARVLAKSMHYEHRAAKLCWEEAEFPEVMNEAQLE